MKRYKKNKIAKAKAIEEAAKIFDKIDGKQVIGHVRIQHPDQEADNIYTLEDGSQVMEDDNGKKITKLQKPKKRKPKK